MKRKIDWMYVILIGIFLSVFAIVCLVPEVNAYEQLKQNNLLNYSFTSNNATGCNITTGNSPTGRIIEINEKATKVGNTFNVLIGGGNFTALGTYCFNIICTDGLTIEPGSVCREVTPSGFNGTLGFYIVIISIIAGLLILGFSIKEEWFVVISGLMLMMLGIYSINYGVAGFRDMFMTWGIGLFEIGIGVILSVGSALSKMED